MKSVWITFCPLILSCLLMPSCAPASRGKIVGTWDYKDFPGLTCGFKTNGRYQATVVTQADVTVSVDAMYSLDGNTFIGGAPVISPDTSDHVAQLLPFGTLQKTIPPKGTIARQSDDEFTITSHNYVRGAHEIATWKKQK